MAPWTLASQRREGHRESPCMSPWASQPAGLVRDAPLSCSVPRSKATWSLLDVAAFSAYKSPGFSALSGGTLVASSISLLLAHGYVEASLSPCRLAASFGSCVTCLWRLCSLCHGQGVASSMPLGCCRQHECAAVSFLAAGMSVTGSTLA